MFRRTRGLLSIIGIAVIFTFLAGGCDISFPSDPTRTPDPSDPKPKNSDTSVPTQGEAVFRFSAAEVTPFPFSGAPVQSPVYETQAGTPVNLLNFVNPDAGCSWAGVAGQVFGPESMPVTGLVVQVGGSLEGSEVLAVTLTGGSLALGAGGYELKLADQPIASQNALYVQLFDLNGNALSNVVKFDTVAACDKNLVLINFTHASIVDRYFIPLITKNTVIYQR